jgi:hypothetical protein
MSSVPATMELRVSGSKGRKYLAGKFRERVSALERPSTSVRIARKTGVRPSEQGLVLDIDGKRYEGTQEMVGTSTDQSTGYVVCKIDRGVMTLTPLAEWYAVKPAITHATIGFDEYEDRMEARNKSAARMDARLKETAKVEVEDSQEDANVAALPDDDDFDDGAGPDWAANEMRNEDGNEGLDMEDEDLFEDDEDDGLGDDDETAFQARQQTKQFASAGVPRRSDDDERAADGASGGGGGADDSDDELDEDAGVKRGEGSTWMAQAKADLRAERKALRKDLGDSSDDDDFDDDDDDGADDALKALIALPPASAPAGESSSAAMEEGGASNGAGKRALPPAAADEHTAKRARQAAVATAAAVTAAPAMAVSERDVVMLLHERGQMSLKELIVHFKPFFKGKEAKADFIRLVSSVAYTLGDAKVVKVNQAMLVKYGLDDPA